MLLLLSRRKFSYEKHFLKNDKVQVGCLLDFSFAPEQATFRLSLSKEMFSARNILYV